MAIKRYGFIALVTIISSYSLLIPYAQSGAQFPSEVERNYQKNLSKIFLASKKGNCQKLKSIIESGADVNQKADYGVTPLILSSSFGHRDCVELLLGYGADPNTITKYGNSALIHAGFYKSWEVAELLISHGADVNVAPERGSLNDPILTTAIMTGASIEFMELLLKKGASIEGGLYVMKGETPLAIAVMGGRDDIVKLFLRRGADPKSPTIRRSFDGRSAIWHARKNGHASTVKLIKAALAYKPKLNIKSITVDTFVKQIFTDESIQISKEGKDVEKYVMSLQTKDIKLIKNAIFARKDYKFSTPWITEYFEKHFPSYSPKTTTISMTKIDKSNVKFLKAIETKKLKRSK